MPGISKREIVEQTTHFNFTRTHIWADNDEIAVSQKFESGINGSIKAQEFYDLINKLPFDEIFIEQEENKIKITDGQRFEASIKTVETIRQQNANPPEVNSKKWMKLPENFTKAATFCVFSASRNMQQPELCCIWFVQDDDQAFAISCDGYRGTMFELKGKVEKDFLLPASVAKHMNTYNPTKYMVEENWMHFINNEHTVLSCRIIAGEYPEEAWDFFDVTGEKVQLPSGIIDVVKRAETLVAAEFDQDRVISLTFSDGELLCKGEGPLGSVKEKIEVPYKGDKTEIKVHPTLFADIAKYQSEVELGERLKFTAEDFVHCVCQFVSDEEE